MKIAHNISFISMAAAMVSSVLAAEPVKVAGDYIPTDKFVQGSIVNVQFDEELPQHMQKIDQAASKLTPEVQEEIRKTIKPGHPVPYDERLGLGKEAYDAYIASWNKRKIVDVAPAVIGLVPANEKGVYKMLSSTEAGPLPFSTLKYDENKGVWISPNGTLERKDDVDFSELNNLGAWKGHEWLYENKTPYSHLIENILVGKTADGKYVYLIYNFLEYTTQGTPIDNKTVVLRIPVADPLLEKAKANKGGKL